MRIIIPNLLEYDMSWHYFQPKFEYEALFTDHTWPWAGHKFFAYDLVQNTKPSLVVELGTHYGTSFFSMSQAVKDMKLKTQLHAIDSWEGDPQAGFYDESVFDTVKKIQKKYYPDQNIHLHKMYFDDALASFKDNSIDILHIDGLHTYEAVKNDFDTWFDKVKDDGIILFHDTNAKLGDFGVYKLWEELQKKFETMEFLHSNGLGILFKKKSMYDWVKREAEFQDHYSGLHAKYLYPVIIEEKEKEIHELRTYIGGMETHINDNAILREELQQYIESIDLLENSIRIMSSSTFFQAWQTYSKLRGKK